MLRCGSTSPLTNSSYDCTAETYCTHKFHKSGLRKWLVQQQSCPTCRADIAATEALEASRAEDRLLDADFVPGFHP
jgi:RING-H2 zinc finger domain